MEYFRVPPRWLFVKITDELGVAGWGEASLEGHTEAVEGCLDSWFERYKGLEAEYVMSLLRRCNIWFILHILNIYVETLRKSGSSLGAGASTVEDQYS